MIDFPLATLARLKAEAEATGKDIQTVVREAVEARFTRRRQALAEMLKPIHDETETSGIGEKELERLVDQAVADARAEQKGSRDH
jgi:hypothetical protein